MASIKQGSNETLKAYAKCFNKELATIHNLQENRVLMVAISGVRPETPFWDKLQKEECKTLQEFYRRENNIMRLETVHTGRSTPIEAPHKIALVGKSTSTEEKGIARNERMEIADDPQIPTRRRPRA